MMTLSSDQMQQILIWTNLILTLLKCCQSTIRRYHISTTLNWKLSMKIRRQWLVLSKIRNREIWYTYGVQWITRFWNYHIFFEILPLSCINRSTQEWRKSRVEMRVNFRLTMFQSNTVIHLYGITSEVKVVSSRKKRSDWSRQKNDNGYFLIGIWFFFFPQVYQIYTLEMKKKKTYRKNERVLQ